MAMTRPRKSANLAIKPRIIRAPVGRWGERRDGILIVANALFFEHGYEDVSMALVAEKAGLSEGTLYNYFTSKTDLVLRATTASLEKRVAAAEHVVDEARTLRAGLAGLIVLHLDATVNQAETYRMWLREVRGAKTSRQAPQLDVLARFAHQFPRLVERFGGKVDPAFGLTASMMRDIVFGGCEHVAATVILRGRVATFDMEASAGLLAETFLRAFGLDGEALPVAAKSARAAVKKEKAS